MADGVLLAGLELGHRAVVVGPRVVGDERRVIAEAAAATGLAVELALAAAVNDQLRSVLADVSQSADVGDRRSPAASTSLSRSARFSSSVASSPA